jgi:cytidylate kinase
MKITIFGLEGTGTSSTGKLLAEKISYRFRSSGVMMREMAEKEGITLEEFNTNRFNIMNETGDTSSDFKIDDYIKEFGENNNNFIFESRLAWFLIPDSFKVKLVCEDYIRISRVSDRDGVSQEDAMGNNKRRQEENKSVYEKMYKGIIYPPEDDVFDLVIDTSNLSLDDVVKDIINKIK